MYFVYIYILIYLSVIDMKPGGSKLLLKISTELILSWVLQSKQYSSSIKNEGFIFGRHDSTILIALDRKV